ncbi:UNKNOWN [Stylonychia lemnae]|uniref:Uncharacterized protein n=1 Tax=Stylonychia lemnae TaxID=5949 RepID=A0A078AT96_STYLE|nr:UNKNOWN [Stylonychia lemnae]|eukprot:CDW85419.1 UNKNOWN [Stylonychia lemnae]
MINHPQAQFYEPEFEVEKNNYTRSKSPAIISAIKRAQMNNDTNQGKIVFKVKTDVDIQHLGFSQRRKIGFRNKYEFDKKRILVADSQRVKVIGFDQQSQMPYDIAEYEIYKIDEQIQYATFFDDFNPKLILIVTYNRQKDRTYFKALKLAKNLNPDQQLLLQQQRECEDLQQNNLIEESSSLDLKEKLVNEIKQNLAQNLLDASYTGYENYQVTLQNGDQISIKHRAIVKGRFENQRKIISIQSPQNGGDVQDSSAFPSDNNLEELDIDAPMKLNKYKVVCFKLLKLENTHLLYCKYKTCSYNGKSLYVVDSIDLSLRQYLFRDLELLNDQGIEQGDRSQLNLDELIKVRIHELNPYENANLALVHQRSTNSQRIQTQMIIKNILNYGDYLILSYENNFNVDLYSKNGICMDRIDIEQLFLLSDLRVMSIDYTQMCRLDWSDRYFDFVQLTYKQIPTKILLAGLYTSSLLKYEKNNSYVLMLNRTNKQQSIIKAFKSQYRITSLNYGPYDNGHVLVGMENGTLLAFSSIDMSKLYQVRIFDREINRITIDPTNQVILGSNQSQELATVTFIESKVDYVYVDLGKKKFCTILLNKNAQTTRSKTPTYYKKPISRKLN